MSQSREKQEIGKWPKGISPKTKIRNFRREKISGKDCLGDFLEPIALYLTAKKLEKTNDKISRKCQKTGFPVFSENRAPSLFGHCHFASLCQKSEKTNEPIPRKAGNRRTNGRTDGRTSVNLKDLRGRSKNKEV